MPRKKRTTSTKPTSSRKTLNKSAFIRSLPLLSTKEVIRKAQETGMTLTDKQVESARAAAKMKEKSGSKGKKRGRPSNAAKPLTSGISLSTSASSTRKIPPPPKSYTHLTPEATSFVHAALDIGLTKAEALLRDVRHQLTHFS